MKQSSKNVRIYIHLKDSLCGRTFETDETAIKAINNWIEVQDKNFFIGADAGFLSREGGIWRGPCCRHGVESEKCWTFLCFCLSVQPM